MFNRTPQHDDRGNSREQNTNARQAAEALFSPKPQPTQPSVPSTTPAGEAVRKPRVLAVAAPAPIPRDEPKATPNAKPPKNPEIPAAHVARIRAWLNYGMSAAQVAEMYGIAPSEVERILRLA